jgi:A/G-specific adenine glycosylase
MELGALICKPKNPSCTECPLINSCKSFLKKDFVLTKIKKINKSKYFELSIIKKNNKYLLIKNNKFNFLKNFIIFPMVETKASSKFKKDLNIKISNMTMYIQIKFENFYTNTSNAIWIDPGKLNNYTLPTFTKKIFRHLKNKI